MGPREIKPDKICSAGGRVFRLLRVYNELSECDEVIYPDFAKTPAYTAEGRPFCTAADESCPHSRHKTAHDAVTDDCGGCFYFHREEPYAIIGVCMCDARRRKTQPRREKKT